MERLKKIIQSLGNQSTPPTEEKIIHTVREYLQVVILKMIFQSNYGAALSFMGGTSLRLCYDLKRFSEDLNFAWSDQGLPYDFRALVESLERELKLRGFETSTNIHEEKRAQKAMVRFSGLGQAFQWKTFRKEQKVNVKLEVDVDPVPLNKDERESFFINRFQEIFPILKHNKPTLFAGKILAILQRPFDRGRDYYDLLWYLSQKIPLNLGYLNRGLKERECKNISEVFERVQSKVNAVKAETILKDIQALLEDPSELQWIRDYPKAFTQLRAEYKEIESVS